MYDLRQWFGTKKDQSFYNFEPIVILQFPEIVLVLDICLLKFDDCKMSSFI